MKDLFIPASGRVFWSFALVIVLLLAACGKNSSPVTNAESQQTKPAGPAEPKDAGDEAMALKLYEHWDNAHFVKLSPDDMASLPAQAAESAKTYGEVIDLQLLLGHDANPELFTKVNQIVHKQIENVEEEVRRQPKAVQDIFRSFLSGGRSARNPRFIGDSHVLFECENPYDASDGDQYSDAYLWDLKDGSLKCQSAGEGVDGDWECRETSASADGTILAFERRFMGPRGEIPKDSFRGMVWLRDGNSGVAPLSTVEEWKPDGGFVFPKEKEKSFYLKPVVSGDGRKIVASLYLAENRGDYDEGTSQLVMFDGETKTARALTKFRKLDPYTISRDGNIVALYSMSWSTGDRGGISRLPTDGSPEQSVPLPEGAEISGSKLPPPSLSADGSRLVFIARYGGQPQVFLHDAATGEVSLVSASPAGVPGNGGADEAVISADGSTIAFVSHANNLMADQAYSMTYLHDVATHKNRVITVRHADGKLRHILAESLSLNSDGGRLAFLYASDELPGVRKVKKPGSAPRTLRLFVARLDNGECVSVGEVLK